MALYSYIVVQTFDLVPSACFGVPMSRRLPRSVVGAITLAVALGNVALVGSAAHATTETYTSVTANASPQTFDNGGTATATFANNGIFAGSYYAGGGFNAPKLKYQVKGTDNSSIKITFSTAQSELDLYYGWVNPGDESVVFTDLAQDGLDFTTTGLVVSHAAYATCGDCYGVAALDSAGRIKAPDATTGRAYSGVIHLHFDSPITWIQVLGPATRTDPDGWNGFGFDIPVVTHTVTFNSNYGTATTTTQTKGVPTNLNSNTFARAGYTFDGWNDQSDGQGTDYAEGASYNFDADTTLYAQWTRDSSGPRIVTFDPNGGSGTMAEVTSGVAGPLPTNTLTLDGYTFAGWNTQQDGQGTPYADGATFDFGSDQTLFAQWIQNHTVTFDPNGGTGTMPDQSIGGTAPLAENTLTREGYTFAGWNTERDGSGTPYADGADFDFSSDQTLYAQWTEIGGFFSSSGLGSLVNTGLSLLGPAGTAGAILAIGAPFFFLSDRFRRVRAYGAIVLHKSSHVTISTPATIFDRLRRKKD